MSVFLSVSLPLHSLFLICYSECKSWCAYYSRVINRAKEIHFIMIIIIMMMMMMMIIIMIMMMMIIIMIIIMMMMIIIIMIMMMMIIIMIMMMMIIIMMMMMMIIITTRGWWRRLHRDLVQSIHSTTWDVAQWWLERRNSNPKTLGSIPWRGRVRDNFSLLPSHE